MTRLASRRVLRESLLKAVLARMQVPRRRARSLLTLFRSLLTLFRSLLTLVRSCQVLRRRAPAPFRQATYYLWYERNKSYRIISYKNHTEAHARGQKDVRHPIKDKFHIEVAPTRYGRSVLCAERWVHCARREGERGGGGEREREREREREGGRERERARAREREREKDTR
jgi:hypothetical protein